MSIGETTLPPGFIVDDNADGRNGLRQLLESAGLGCEVFKRSATHVSFRSPNVSHWLDTKGSRAIPRYSRVLYNLIKCNFRILHWFGVIKDSAQVHGSFENSAPPNCVEHSR